MEGRRCAAQREPSKRVVAEAHRTQCRAGQGEMVQPWTRFLRSRPISPRDGEVGTNFLRKLPRGPVGTGEMIVRVQQRPWLHGDRMHKVWPCAEQAPDALTGCKVEPSPGMHDVDSALEQEQ